MMKKNRITEFAFSVALWISTTVTAFSESISFTPPAGYFALPVNGNSDNHLSLPLMQKTSGFGTVSAAGRDRVTISSKRWREGQFRRKSATGKASYVAEFVTGPLRGISYEVLDNNSDTLVLDMQGDSLTQHPSGSIAFGDLVRLRPLWTASTVFGDTEDNLQIAAKRNQLVSGDAIIIPDNSGNGVNKAPSAQLSFVRGSGWRSSSGNQLIDQADYPFAHGQPMNVRRLSSQKTAILVIGYVPRSRQAIYVPDGGTVGSDNFVGLLGPEAVSLQDSGLIDLMQPSQNGAFQQSSNEVFRADELMSYEGASGYNQTPRRAFYFLNNRGWREVGLHGIDVGQSIMLQPGRSYMIRKKGGSPGGDWLQPSQESIDL